MEEIDGMIFHRLIEIGCDLSPDIKSIKSLSPDDLSEAIVRCLRIINPDTPISTSKLPANVAVRYRFATTLAEAIMAIGYKGNLGYQTILYGNEHDRRRLLMFLMEQLPKEGLTSSSITESTISAIEFIKRIVSERIRRELQPPYSPWFSKTFDSDFMNWRQPYFKGDISFQSDRLVSSTNLLDNLRSFYQIPANVLAMNSMLFQTDTKLEQISYADDTSIILHYHNVKEQSFLGKAGRKVKPALLPKPVSLKAKMVPEITDQQEEQSHEKELQLQAARELEEKRDALTNGIASMEQEIEQKTIQSSRMEEMLQTIVKTVKRIQETLPSKEMELKQLRLMVELAPNADANVKQLKEYIEKSDSRMEKLALTKDDVCAPLIREIAETKQASLSKPESQRLADEMATLEYKSNELRDEMNAKKGHLQTLQREFEKMQKDVNRAYYTKRILEIVANVNKQKQEIARVLEEIRDTQRDVNMLSGKLDRSFTATDELLYKDATTDDFIKRAYRCFVSLHETCTAIVSHIENAGHLEREMRDLDDKIDTESRRSVDSTLESLVNDYCEMKAANEALFSKLRQAGIDI